MPTRTSEATWNGDLKSGKGTMRLGSGAYEGQYSFKSRFEEGTGTNPEELIAAAHAGCYAMAFSNMLAEAGYTPDEVNASAQVHLDMSDGPVIDRIHLVVDATVPGIDEDTFMEHAEKAKDGCPVSQVLAAADITLDATLNA